MNTKKNLPAAGPEDPFPVYYTVEDISDLFSVSRATVEIWFTDGTLAGRKVGNTWRTYPTALNSFFLRHAASPRLDIVRKPLVVVLDLE